MNPLKKILVPIDFSVLSVAAAARAATLARLEGGSVHLLHAVQFPPFSAPYDTSIPPGAWDGVRKAAERKLEEQQRVVEKMGITDVSIELSDSGDAARSIAAAVEAESADVVVMGTRGLGGLERAFIGSVAERTLRTVDCPVLVVKGDLTAASQPIERILLAVDGSTHSDRAAEHAGALATRLGASVDVICVWDIPRHLLPHTVSLDAELERKLEHDTRTLLREVGDRLHTQDVALTLHCRRGAASAAICEAAEDLGSQLIVMGTRGSSGLSHIVMGSVAERTIRSAPCSVMAAKAPEGEQAP